MFVTWFASGIVMMYWDFPSVGAADRLARSPALDPTQIHLSPREAAANAGVDTPEQVRLNMFDGRPVYRLGSEHGEAIVYADTGEEQVEVSTAMVESIAGAWTGQPVSAARAEQIDEVDQWTIQSRLRDIEPLWKYSWPDGQQVYVSQASGEVVQYTTTASRWAAYLGAIPHWLYFTPLRKHGPVWSLVVIWSSGIGTVAAILGIVIAVWMYSPSKRYRYGGAPTGIPYRGWKRWHAILGLVFGLGAVTWAFSGMLSMDPFPVQRAGGPGSGARDDSADNVLQALRGHVRLEQFDAKRPSDALAQLARFRVKELEFTSFAGEPVYLATISPGDTRIVPVMGEPQVEFDRRRMIDAVTKGVRSPGRAEVRVLDQYDRYYLDRRRQLPLPVILAQLNDIDHTRYYIDLKTARIVGSYGSRNWISRWPYHALHSLNLPWLYRYRPAWDVVVIIFMLGGTALCLTSLILAWRVLGRTMGGAFAAGNDTEDIVIDSAHL